MPTSFELRKLLFRWVQRCPKTFVFGTRTGSKLIVRNFQRKGSELRTCRRRTIGYHYWLDER